jgi:alkanesulfonate monooxygenase SsuD/methylene tetrahydromethanopterin reductase-like flavin-dependent oxidoreductase (luciferase family)
MQIGMTLPSMAAGCDRDAMLAWCRGIDEGSFSSLACGERITFHNPEMVVLLSAAAALTERVRIVPTLYVLPMHSTARVAKQVATLDVLSGGRVTLGVGVGAREEDYRAVGAPFAGRFARMDAQVADLRRLWSGASPSEGAGPIGPAPLQAGGPPIWAGVLGPKSLARAARWADGIVGFSMDGDADEIARGFEAAEAAWREAGRAGRPRRVTSFWYALGEGAKRRLETYAYDYLRIFGDRPARALAGRTRVHSGAVLRETMAALEEAGCDELILVPTSADPSELARTIEVLS